MNTPKLIAARVAAAVLEGLVQAGQAAADRLRCRRWRSPRQAREMWFEALPPRRVGG